MTDTKTIDAKDIELLLKKIILNTKEKKQTPYDIKIKNRIREPKIVEDMRFTPKQKYRMYKTKIEPNLFSKIMIDEEDDIVAKLKQEFDNKKLYPTSEVKSTPLQSTPLKSTRAMQTDGEGITDIKRSDAETITGLAPSNLIFRLSPEKAEQIRKRRDTLFGTPFRASVASQAETPQFFQLTRERQSKPSTDFDMQLYSRGSLTVPRLPHFRVSDDELNILYNELERPVNTAIIPAVVKGAGRGTPPKKK